MEEKYKKEIKDIAKAFYKSLKEISEHSNMSKINDTLKKFPTKEGDTEYTRNSQGKKDK